MSSLPRLPLAAAKAFAEKIKAELTPYCRLIEIAGSIRRRRLTCGDVDIVCLPRDLQELKRRVLANLPRVVKNGDQEFVTVFAERVQLDLWLAAPDGTDLFAPRATNFGSLLLCRTGSPAHNIFLVQRAKDLGLRWNPHWGVFDAGNCIASETEEAIFTALKLDYVPPERRER